MHVCFSDDGTGMGYISLKTKYILAVVNQDMIKNITKYFKEQREEDNALLF